MIDKSNWKEIERELKGLFCHVNFKYQETVISIVRERMNESRSKLVVYFNHTLCVGWGDEECDKYNPLTKLFCLTGVKPLYSKTKVAEMEKQMGKRYLKKTFPEVYSHQTYLSPIFANASQLIRQYKKIDGLEWVNER
ncbi:hypothetical protein [Photorhabdus viridis]|uniref:hypothetical protein n=1 Tax=Photorhabdus viridis TaxID=3163327 RepID=UPI003306C94F